MADNTRRSRGRPGNYRVDRGGAPADFGPFLGIVKNNIDPTRSGRLQVYIEAFADGNENDPAKWITVSYMPPFYGVTPYSSSPNTGPGTYPGNPNSYGMWFTPPDLEIEVVVIFVNGDPTLGYYIGVVPADGLNHMVPAIGAESNYVTGNANQAAYFAEAPLLPVTEINNNDPLATNAGEFFNREKPVHSVVASALFQQGVAKDPERGPIQSSSQRESPSAVFGVSTPGTAVYRGGLTPADIKERIDSGYVTPRDVEVIARMGGHSFVMDDGDMQGNNQLVRLRTAKGHQITMNDTGNFFYILHANGQTWIELGQEGTVDIFSTNSVNVRTQGDLNFHADRDINLFAGRNFNAKAVENMQLEAEIDLVAMAQQNLTIYNKGTIAVKADGSLTLQSANGSWAGGSALIFEAGGIDLNGPAATEVEAPLPLTKTLLDDTSFDSSDGWQVESQVLESIVTRAPTHEPWNYHNLGVDVEVELEEGEPSPPPDAPPLPADVEITAL